MLKLAGIFVNLLENQMSTESNRQEENKPDPQKAKGGHARSEALTPEERSEIARNAAIARWDADIPQAAYEGDFRIGPLAISAAVLPNGKRLLTQATFLRAIGRSRSPKGGTGVLSTVDGTPFFLQAEILKPFITEELRMSTTPIFFRAKSGKKMVGYDAELLPMVAELYLEFRDHYAGDGGLPRQIASQYQKIIKACDMLIRGLAHVGIIALVDEATGYQDVRDRQALQEIIDKYLTHKFAAWSKTFPDEFYQEIFRLRGWEWRGMKVNRPQCVAQYTTNLVYERVAPGIIKNLEERNPVLENGRRKGKHTQLFTPDFGCPALSSHIHAVLGLMRASDTWDDLMRMADRAFPKFEKSGQLKLFR